MHHPTFTCGHEDTSFVWRYARRTESTHKEYSLHTSSTIRYVHQKGTISTNSQYGVVACVCKSVNVFRSGTTFSFGDGRLAFRVYVLVRIVNKQ